MLAAEFVERGGVDRQVSQARSRFSTGDDVRATVNVVTFTLHDQVDPYLARREFGGEVTPERRVSTRMGSQPTFSGGVANAEERRTVGMKDGLLSCRDRAETLDRGEKLHPYVRRPLRAAAEYDPVGAVLHDRAPAAPSGRPLRNVRESVLA